MDNKAKVSKESTARCRYGISPEDVESLRIKQDNKCAICSREFSPEWPYYIDHDHSSSWVRGLLCRSCNFAIGLLQESADIIEAAARYIISNATPTEFNFGAAKAAVRKSTGVKGRITTAETKEKQSLARLGKVPWNKGLPWSEEHKQALRKSKKFSPRGPKSEAHKEAIRATLKARVTPEHKEIMRQRGIIGAAARWRKA